MTTKSIVQLFEQYRHSRLNFIRSLSDLSLRESNLEILLQCDVLEIIKPLLNDNCKQIQQCATITLGRLAHHNTKIAQKILDFNYLPILVEQFSNEKQKLQKSSILFVLRSIAKHSAHLAGVIVDFGVLKRIVDCLEDFELVVRESAAWTIGYIARHNEKLAQSCVDCGCIPLLIQGLLEPQLAFKQIAISCLADIAKHSINLAQIIIDNDGVGYLARNLNDLDGKLKRQILIALAACAKHSIKFAEVIIEAEVIPTVLMHMSHESVEVRRNATILIRDTVKHSLETCEFVVKQGGLEALIEILFNDCNEVRIPCIMALGYIAGYSEQFASMILDYKAITVLQEILLETTDDENLLAVSVWALGQIGKHSPEHSKAVASVNLFQRMIEIYDSRKCSDDLGTKIKTTLKQCLQHCVLLSALEPLLYEVPVEILECVLIQFSKILPYDPKARRLFVTTGALRRLQEINAAPGSSLEEYRVLINSCFPEEIVDYYSPNYSKTLLEKVEKYSPQY